MFTSAPLRWLHAAKLPQVRQPLSGVSRRTQVTDANRSLFAARVDVGLPDSDAEPVARAG